MSKLFFVLLLSSFSLAIVFVSQVPAEEIEDLTLLAIDSAEVATVSAYEVVLEAEQAGAEVSGLLFRLNGAEEYLASAHNWYRLGAFDNASHLAVLCEEIGKEVGSEAIQLRDEARLLYVNELVVRITVSIIGVILIVFLSFLGWLAFKRRYLRRVSEMKPEVVPDEP